MRDEDIITNIPDIVDVLRERVRLLKEENTRLKNKLAKYADKFYGENPWTESTYTKGGFA